ncbi:MAG TPA: TIGR03086 family metal-binding protein [Candidatus Deferrimicrobium sp.]|nr:TIGR03086 family metal-binding protein [Candidatus Deferrimicrobium sp.]
MAEPSPPLMLLGRALDQTSDLIAGTHPDQAELRTPCQSWTVQQLVDHLISDLGNFAAGVRGEKPDWSKAAGAPGGEWVGAFASARRELDGAWSAADLDALVPGMSGEAPLVSRADPQIAELGIHAWDLARATGQSEELDPDVAEYGLRWGTANLAAQFRGPEEQGKVFGPEVQMPNDAPVYERLAGWFGRDPGWSQPG